MRDTRFDGEIDFLLDKACDSIRYLVKRDLLGVPADSAEMTVIEEKILAQPNVQKVLAAQCEDGWFGHELHGIDGMDHLIGELLNAGVEKEHPAIQKAIRALITPEVASQHKNRFRGGDALDEGGRGGNRAVTAQILSWVRCPEDHPLIKEQIELSLDHTTAAINYASVDDFTKTAGGKRFYKENARFPGANHIAMLAATESWRTDENIRAVKGACAHCYELMRNVDEFITFKKPEKFGGGFVGPFNYNWQALTPITEEQLTGIINGSYNFGFAFSSAPSRACPISCLVRRGLTSCSQTFCDAAMLTNSYPSLRTVRFVRSWGRSRLCAESTRNGAISHTRFCAHVGA